MKPGEVTSAAKHQVDGLKEPVLGVVLRHVAVEGILSPYVASDEQSDAYQ